MVKMKKRFILLFFVLTGKLCTGQPDLASIRSTLEKAVNDEASASGLLLSLEQVAGTDPLLIAYKGAAQALLARQDWNPFRKIRNTKNSMHSFQQAIQLDPMNVEIRFLRFAVQSRLPSFLKMSNDMIADKKVILENIQSISNDKNMVRKIVRFMSESNQCSRAEIILLNKYSG